MQSLRIWLSRSAKVAEFISVAMFFVIFALFIASVVMRYVFARPLEWVDEFILVMFLWTTFLTEALVLTEREQVTFDVVYDLCGPRARRGLGLVASFLIAAMFIVATPTVFGYVMFLWRERTSVLEWRLDYVYACFLVYWIAVIVRAVAKFVALCGARWQAHVANVQADERANVLG